MIQNPYDNPTKRNWIIYYATWTFFILFACGVGLSVGKLIVAVVDVSNHQQHLKEHHHDI